MASRESSDDVSMDPKRDHGRSYGYPMEALTQICPAPPLVPPMSQIRDTNYRFLIQPYEYNRSIPNLLPIAIYRESNYVDRWDEDHVRMPCSPHYQNAHHQPKWPIILSTLSHLKEKCARRIATFDDLKKTIGSFLDFSCNMDSLDKLINDVFTKEERRYFLSTTLSELCSLAMSVDRICSTAPPLLKIASNHSLTFSQLQAASLLACAFFCLFPHRSGRMIRREYRHFQNPNFYTLYQGGNPKKISKLQCIFHYFRRVTDSMPTGVVTIRRYALSSSAIPNWSASNKTMMPTHFTPTRKIEDIPCTLQVDFANEYIGGGVLNSGCVQEEIRFVLSPETLISLLICEVMKSNECIYLIGCEQFSNYSGYSNNFQFAGNFFDRKEKDDWGRNWCHIVAMDAIYYRNPSDQYKKENIKRELLKAYTAFHTRATTASNAFPITTGHWGCGAFNGDRQLIAMIQLMASAQVVRPMIYAAYTDGKFVEAFARVYDYLFQQKATVQDIYAYLKKYDPQTARMSLFDFICRTPRSSL